MREITHLHKNRSYLLTAIDQLQAAVILRQYGHSFIESCPAAYMSNVNKISISSIGHLGLVSALLKKYRIAERIALYAYKHDARKAVQTLAKKFKCHQATEIGIEAIMGCDKVDRPKFGDKNLKGYRIDVELVGD